MAENIRIYSNIRIFVTLCPRAAMQAGAPGPQRSPAADAVEMLHQAAFRSGLGNSLYCAPHKVGSHSTAALQTFVSKHFTSGRSALLGIGVNHASLAKFGELLNLEAGSGPADVASKYSGGEVCISTVF